MDGLTDFITQYTWEDIFTVWFVLVDDAHKVLVEHFGKWRRRGTPPVFADSEVITIALIADTLFAGREDKALKFVREYHLDLFPRLPFPGTFNARRRALNLITEQVRRVLLAQWGLLETEELGSLGSEASSMHTTERINDSAPIPVCTYARAKQSRTIEQTWAPRELFFGVSSSRKAKVFGFRLHLDTTIDQVVDSWLLAPASMHDSQSLGGLHEGEDVCSLMILADGAFNDSAWLASVRHKHDDPSIKLWALPRRDARPTSKSWSVEFRSFISRIRRRVETALSVMSTVFWLEQPGSRSLSGLVSRVSTRMLAYTLCFLTGPLLAFWGFHSQN